MMSPGLTVGDHAESDGEHEAADAEAFAAQRIICIIH
jgi:hypothetical protein